jgi:hypothetical protein
MCAVGWMGYDNTTNKPTGIGNRELSHKIMAVHKTTGSSSKPKQSSASYRQSCCYKSVGLPPVAVLQLTACTDRSPSCQTYLNTAQHKIPPYPYVHRRIHQKTLLDSIVGQVTEAHNALHFNIILQTRLRCQAFCICSV